MPIYEYFCDNCNVEYEAIQKVSDAALTKCSTCDEETLVKQASKSAFHLKGGGWYRDGYGGGDKKAGGNEPKPAKPTEKSTATQSKKASSTNSAKPAASSTSKNKAS